jgi:hypothetical protein
MLSLWVLGRLVDISPPGWQKEESVFFFSKSIQR